MILRPASVLDTWSRLVPGRAGMGPRLLALLAGELQILRVPGMHCKPVTVASGTLAAIRGRRKPALLVRARSFREFGIVIGAWDHGTSLYLVKHVIATPRLWNGLRRVLLFGKTAWQKAGAELGPVEQADLDAWIGAVNHTVSQAVRRLTAGRSVSRRAWTPPRKSRT